MKTQASMVIAVLLVASVGPSFASPATPNSGEPERGGPPPPGYERIVGEPVPGWKPSDMTESGTSVWTPLGPRPIKNEYWSGSDDASGRVVSIAPHPSNANTVYIAAASGGIWKTVDGGAVWTPLTDELSILNHGCVALDPSDPDVVYAGTGEYTTRSTGDGVFRSTDAGSTWSRLGTVGDVGVSCSGLIVDPVDPLTIHISGSPSYARSTDGGATWQSLFTTTRGVSSLAMKSGDPNTLYLGEHNVGVWRSTNGGTTWSPLTGTGLPASGMSRILLATSPSVPNNVVTALITSGGSLQGLYRSTNSGGAWSQLVNTPNFPSPQGWYDAFIVIDPASDATMYGGGVFPTYAVAGVIKTTDSGSSWVDITCPGACPGAPGNPHPDMHTMAFGPDGTIWLGNDGGVWKSTNGGAGWINVNDTLTVTQNYQIAVNPLDNTIMMGGTQDNGSPERQSETDDWHQIQIGDGGYLEYDFLAPSIRYTTYVYLSVLRKIGSGGNVDISGPWSGDRKNFIAPLVMDPNDSDSLLGGTYRIWRTTNASTTASWTAISGDLTAGGRLNAIDVALGNSDTIYTGSNDGKVFVTTNGTLWNDRSTGLPSGSITDVAVDPNDHATAYVTFSNTSGARVLTTPDQGVSWSDATGDLPTGVAGRALAVDYRTATPLLILGSGSGVWSSNDGGATWTKDATDLPNVNIGDLHIDEATNTVFAGTYGRGTWKADLIALNAVIFTDGFESGDTTAWSVTLP